MKHVGMPNDSKKIFSLGIKFLDRLFSWILKVAFFHSSLQRFPMLYCTLYSLYVEYTSVAWIPLLLLMPVRLRKSSGSSYLFFHRSFFSKCPKLLNTSYFNCSKASSRCVFQTNFDNGYSIFPKLFETVGRCVSNLKSHFVLKVDKCGDFPSLRCV
jgi:hypothetical protein